MSQRERFASVVLAMVGMLGIDAEDGRAANKVMFVTSIDGTGDLDTWPGAGFAVGLQAADNVCQARATAVGLGGTVMNPRVFRAWLSDDDDDAFCRVRSASGHGKRAGRCGGIDPFVFVFFTGGPWVRRDGYPFSGNLFALASGNPLITPPRLDENGFDIGGVGSALAWSGTDLDGTGDVNDCADWFTDNSMTYGLVSKITSTLISQVQSANCANTLYIYCFEVGLDGDPLPKVEEPAGLAFVTSASGPGDLSSWPGAQGSGLAAADARCRDAATAAHLPTPASFVAWLSATGVDAKNRITFDGPWKRLDGVRIAASKADLTDNNLFSAVALDEHGAPAYSAWTGTEGHGNAVTDRCGDWTVASGAFGTWGLAFETSVGWTVRGTSDCFELRSLYCFSTVVTDFWDNFESGNVSRWSAAQ